MRTMSRFGRRRILWVYLFAVGISLLSLVGCATAPAKDAIPPFRQGLLTAEQQTNATFADVNKFLRQQQVERAIKQDALTEDLFFQAIESGDIAKWNRAFALIDSYAEKLERLLNEEQRAGVEAELSDLGKEIESMRGEQLPEGVSAAFTKFGGLLVQLKAERDALKAIRQADPGIQQVFNSMMEAIGSDNESGVRGTVWTSWAQVLASIDVKEFRQARSPDAKRPIVLKYIQSMEERDAQDQLLNSLRLSIATLAKTHQEMAKDRPASASALIKIVQDEYKDFRQQLKEIRKLRENATNNGGTK